MILRVDRQASGPVYQQIRGQIVAAIAEGQLISGQRLPSVLTLAADLEVNFHTVNRAYAQLRDEGYLTMHGRSGAVISDFNRSATPDQRVPVTELVATGLYQLALEHRAQGGNTARFPPLRPRCGAAGLPPARLHR